MLSQGHPAVLSHPALLYPRSPVGRESIKTGTKADSPDGLYNSGERIFTALCPVDGELVNAKGDTDEPHTIPQK